MTAPLLEARRLGVAAPAGPRILDDVSLAIRAGDRLALQGPNGSGKTTLLTALAELVPAATGEILWRGEPVAAHDVPRFRSRVAYLPQRSTATQPSVAAELRWPSSLGVHAERDFGEARVREAIGRWGRDARLLERDPATLSGGELQFVALLRTLLTEPRVLLLDEPTAAMDAPTTAVAESLLRDWFANGERAWLWVTHSPAQTDRVADRVIRLRAGRIEDFGHASPRGGDEEMGR